MKIPGNCKVCEAPLSAAEMAHFLELSERAGKDPMVAAGKGILCSSCAIRELTDQAEESADSDGARIIRSMRRQHLNIRRVK